MQDDLVETLAGAVRFWRGGKGPPLVLLQGGMGDAALHWSGMWSTLAERYEVFAPDLPGFGGSTALPRTTFSALTGWLHGFSSAVKLEPPILVGADLGATLARVYSATHPHRCRSVVLINGGGLPSMFQRVGARLSPSAPATPNAQTLFSRARLAEMVVGPAVLTDEFVASCQTSEAVTGIMRDLVLGPAPKHSPHARTLVLWGELDRIMPLEVGRRIAADMPRAAFRSLHGCGHLPHIESPAMTAQALLAFLA